MVQPRAEFLTSPEARLLSIAQIVASVDTCPQGTSNARHVATVAGLKPRGGDYVALGQSRSTASDDIAATLTSLISPSVQTPVLLRTLEQAVRPAAQTEMGDGRVLEGCPFVFHSAQMMQCRARGRQYGTWVAI